MARVRTRLTSSEPCVIHTSFPIASRYNESPWFNFWSLYKLSSSVAFSFLVSYSEVFVITIKVRLARWSDIPRDQSISLQILFGPRTVGRHLSHVSGDALISSIFFFASTHSRFSQSQTLQNLTKINKNVNIYNTKHIYNSIKIYFITISVQQILYIFLYTSLIFQYNRFYIVH
jgi:hypothetical protein